MNTCSSCQFWKDIDADVIEDIEKVEDCDLSANQDKQCIAISNEWRNKDKGIRF